MADLPYDYEVLVIDNASTDRTGEVAAELAARDPRWRYVRFSRNFSVEISIAAGLRFARGDAAMVLFSDLQDPPKLIPDFLRKWEEGHDVVYGQVRSRQGDPLWKAWGARLFYRIINALAEVEITPNATDFRLLSRRAIDALNQFDERNRYLRGFAHWVGFKRCPIVYDRVPRTAGKSKAPSFYLLNLAANAITCFSIKPLATVLADRRRRPVRHVLPGAGLPRQLAVLLHRARPDDDLPADAGEPGGHAARLRRRRRVRRSHLYRNQAAAAVPDRPDGQPRRRAADGRRRLRSSTCGRATGRRRESDSDTGEGKMQPFDGRRLRQTVLRMSKAGSTVHVACTFSLIEMLAVLYRIAPERDRRPGRTIRTRNYLVLSKGHGVMAQYACLHELGWLTDDDIQPLFRRRHQAQGAVRRSRSRPGGQRPARSATAFRSASAWRWPPSARARVSRCLPSSATARPTKAPIWEALLFASHFRLSNLITIIDANGFQAMGTTREVMDMGQHRRQAEGVRFGDARGGRPRRGRLGSRPHGADVPSRRQAARPGGAHGQGQGRVVHGTATTVGTTRGCPTKLTKRLLAELDRMRRRGPMRNAFSRRSA